MATTTLNFSRSSSVRLSLLYESVCLCDSETECNTVTSSWCNLGRVLSNFLKLRLTTDIKNVDDVHGIEMDYSGITNN